MLKLLALVALAAGSGLAIRLALGAAKQRWATTYHATMTYLILPVVGMVITKVISGNIALSLGMIGALSIVRFRHPVKSPLELVIFFDLLTVGITLTVDYRLGALLTAYTVALIIGAALVQQEAARRGTSLFQVSFAEGDPLHTVEVRAGRALAQLQGHPRLTASLWQQQAGYTYRLATANREEAEALRGLAEGQDGVTAVDVRFAV